MSVQSESQAKVPYVRLGKSGLKVSVPIVCCASVLQFGTDSRAYSLDV
jgi:hypothetical protein